MTPQQQQYQRHQHVIDQDIWEGNQDYTKKAGRGIEVTFQEVLGQQSRKPGQDMSSDIKRLGIPIFKFITFNQAKLEPFNQVGNDNQ